MLDVGAHHAGGVFRAQGEGLALLGGGAAAVLPGVHLLGDDVGLLAHGAGEELGLLEDGRADLAEVVGVEDVAGGGLDEVPQRRFRREKIASSADALNHEFPVPGCQFPVTKLLATSYQLLLSSTDPYIPNNS